MNDATDPDALLMLRYARGDAAAFEQLYEHHRGGLWRYLQRQLRDPAVVADVFQDCWSKVIASRASYRPAAKFATWLYRIAHNACVDHWRRSGRRGQREVAGGDDLLAAQGDPAPGPQALAVAAQEGERLEAALAALPDEQRTAFLLYVEGGLSVPEIAAATGAEAEAAKSRLRYAVGKLKQALGEDAPGQER